MIQHDALPSDPDHEEIFEIPEELNLGVSAFIKIYQDGIHIGEVMSLEKIPNMAHSWHLSRIIFFTSVDFSREISIKTLLLAAETLCYINNEGWVIASFRDKPLQKTEYTGFFSKTAVIRDIAVNNVMMYEHIAFKANKKGENL